MINLNNNSCHSLNIEFSVWYYIHYSTFNPCIINHYLCCNEEIAAHLSWVKPLRGEGAGF